MTTNHTPTPWGYHRESLSIVGYYTGGRQLVAGFRDGTVSSEDAAFIVEACNSHAANLARIAELEAALRKLTIAAANVCVQTDGIGVINKVAELRPLIPEMRAALAKGEAC